MIGLDTNVVVRYLTQDDPAQAASATRLFEKTLSLDNPGFISLVTLCEICWVLAGACGAKRDRIAGVVEGLLGSKQIVVENAEIAWRALRSWKSSSTQFSDALIAELAAANGAEYVATFDKAAARLAGFRLLA